jgi:type IV pilus assembly protein PilE
MKQISSNAGFTMIELMVVIAIMAILTMIAYPSYQESIRKSRRSDGIAAALTLQAAQEKFRGSCAVYAQVFDTAAPFQNTCTIGPPNTSAIVAASDSPEGFYTLSIEANSATGNAYTIVITPQGAQTTDTACNPMKIAYGAGAPNGDRTPASCWP